MGLICTVHKQGYRFKIKNWARQVPRFALFLGGTDFTKKNVPPPHLLLAGAHAKQIIMGIQKE